MASTTPWRAIASRKLTERQSLIPKAWLLTSLPPQTTLDVRHIPRESGILTSTELSITETNDAVSLAESIRSGKYTAEAITIAFCKRAAIAQQLTNCLTEIFFDAAIERAKWLDQEHKRIGRTLGPLHGVPVSLKDTFNVKGYDSSLGIASLAFNPAKENSLLVDMLLEQGAVLYCKTNVPQTLMALDSDNNVFGRVLNPRDKRATAGGSSGGEGALIAMRGSVLGVGTDIGGSIRIPAMCNGLYGIKPSSQRIPFAGMETGTRKGLRQIGLPASAGPIATTLRDCELFMKTVSDAKGWERDPEVAYGPWDEQGFLQKKPIIGVIRTDGLITPLPPIKKILDETVQAIRSSGYEVVDINAPAFKKCQSLANAFFGIDGNNNMFDLLEETGEPLTEWLSPRLKRKEATSLDKLLEIQAKKAELQTEMLKIWKDPKTGRQIDAIICPVAPHPVPPIDRWNGVSYTSSWVLLDYPAASLPVRDLKPADLEGEMDSTVLGSWDKANRGLCRLTPVDVVMVLTLLGDEKTMDRKLYLNTVLSIQVVAPRLQERKLVQAMALIDGIIQRDIVPKARL